MRQPGAEATSAEDGSERKQKLVDSRVVVARLWWAPSFSHARVAGVSRRPSECERACPVVAGLERVVARSER